MSPLPQVPSAFRALIITPGASFCTAFIRLLLQLPLIVYEVYNFAVNSSGYLTNAALRLIFHPGSLKFSACGVPAWQSDAWVECNGQAISRTDYADLFAAIGTTYGAGDGSSTFTLPDFRGRVPVGVGVTTGLVDRDGAAVSGSNFTIGTKGGEERVKLIEEEMPAHRHGAGDRVDAVYCNVTSGGSSAPGAGASHDGVTADVTDADHYMAEAGEDETHNNLQPYSVVRVYIKT